MALNFDDLIEDDDFDDFDDDFDDFDDDDEDFNTNFNKRRSSKKKGNQLLMSNTKLMYNTYNILFGALFFFIFTFNKNIDSFRYYGYIFLVNTIIKIILSVTGFIIFDLLISVKFRTKKKIFKFNNQDKFIKSFIYNFFALTLLSLLYVISALYFPNGYEFFYYLIIRFLVILSCTTLTQMVQSNRIAIVLISFSLAILIMVSLLIVIQDNMVNFI